VTRTTAEFGFPYPEGTDPADGPAQLQALAEAVEADVKVLDPRYFRAGTSGQLIIVSGTGAAAYAAMRGDATIIADGTITIGDDKVINRHIGPEAVTNPELADNAVTQAKMADNSVGAAELIADSVGSSELAPDSVTATEIATGAVGNTEIGTNAVDSDEIKADAVGTAEIAANAVGNSEVAADAVDNAEIKDRAVTSRKIVLDCGVVEATGDLNAMKGFYADVPGASLAITPAVASYILITAHWTVINDSSGVMGIAGLLNLDAADLTSEKIPITIFTSTGGIYGGRQTVSMSYKLRLTAAAHTIKMRAKDPTDLGFARCEADGTRFTYMLVAQ